MVIITTVLLFALSVVFTDSESNAVAMKYKIIILFSFSYITFM